MDREKLVSAHGDEFLRVWNSNTFELLHECDASRIQWPMYAPEIPYPEWVKDVAISGHTSRVYAVSYLGAIEWNFQTGCVDAVHTYHDDEACKAVDVDSSGHFLAIGGFDEVCSIFSATEHAWLRSYEEHKCVEMGLHIQMIRLSNDARLVTSVNEGLCAVWRIDDGTTVAKRVGCLFSVFSPDNSKVLSGNRRWAEVWHSASGDLVCVFGGHSRSILAGEFSPDGQSCVTGSLDGMCCIWDAQDGRRLRQIQFPCGVRRLIWTSGGILVLLDNGEVKLEPTEREKGSTGKGEVQEKGRSPIFRPDERE